MVESEVFIKGNERFEDFGFCFSISKYKLLCVCLKLTN